MTSGILACVDAERDKLVNGSPDLLTRFGLFALRAHSC